MNAGPLALRARLATGLSQVEFADQYHLDIQELRRWEAGEAHPDSPTTRILEHVAHVVGTRRLLRDRAGHWRLG